MNRLDSGAKVKLLVGHRAGEVGVIVDKTVLSCGICFYRVLMDYDKTIRNCWEREVEGVKNV